LLIACAFPSSGFFVGRGSARAACAERSRGAAGPRAIVTAAANAATLRRMIGLSLYVRYVPPILHRPAADRNIIASAAPPSS
jgi:hypothetical protein